LFLLINTKPQFGQQKRSFSSEYFKDYQWLEYIIKKDAAFCFPCRNLVEPVLMKILGPKMDSTTGKKQVKYYVYYCIALIIIVLGIEL